MREYGYPSGDQGPLFYWRGYPVRTPTLLVVIHVAALLLGLAVPALLQNLAFVPAAFLNGAFWQPFSYGLVHPSRQALWLAIELYLLWSFGREVEQGLGRRAFLQLYGILWLLAPAVVLIVAFLQPVRQLAGSSGVHFAIFIAFATLYPSAQMLLGITAKWAAVILIAVSVVQAVGARATHDLLVLTASVSCAFFFVRWAQGRVALPSLRRIPFAEKFKKKPKFRVVKPPAKAAPAPAKSAKKVTLLDPQEQMDLLLDKIARSGMSSLSAAERQQLEKLSAQLNERDRV